ncbi:F-box/kelch-repeat protein At3g06240 [Linum grandiflorum]
MGASYIPQDLTTNILLRLSDGSAIARFRCVNKQWLALLSDPKFIHQILWFDLHNDEEKEKKKSTNVLITRPQTYGEIYRVRLVYSLLSYNEQNERLTGPIKPSTKAEEPRYLKYQQVPMVPGAARPKSYDWNRFEIVGCCDGIFCIYDQYSKIPEDTILWNPSTSETKVLPASPHIPTRPSAVSWQQIGFGFDSKTQDYKVMRRRGLYRRRDPMILTDIYSLENDSWKEHSRKPPVDNEYRACIHPTRNVARSRNSGLRRVYWYSDNRIASFDMVEEVYDDLTHKRFPKKLKKSMSYGDKIATECIHLQTTSKEFMLSAVFGNPRGVYEIWGLLDFRKRRSWTKLFVVSKFLVADIRMGLGPQGAGGGGGGCYMFLKINGKLLAYNPETEEVKEDILGFRAVPKNRCVGVRTVNFKSSAYSYVPSQVLISSLTVT